jgi:hypothetical protein
VGITQRSKAAASKAGADDVAAVGERVSRLTILSSIEKMAIYFRLYYITRLIQVILLVKTACIVKVEAIAYQHNPCSTLI